MLPNLSPRGLLLLCLQLALTVIASGGAFDSKDVLRLTTKNFEEEVNSSNIVCCFSSQAPCSQQRLGARPITRCVQVSGERIVAVKFYAPWCGKPLSCYWLSAAPATSGCPALCSIVQQQLCTCHTTAMVATLAGHCKRLAPTWKELAAAYKTNNNVQIAHIDCTKNATVCKQAQV